MTTQNLYLPSHPLYLTLHPEPSVSVSSNPVYQFCYTYSLYDISHYMYDITFSMHDIT